MCLFPLVSAIIPVYNCVDFVEYAVQSALTQSYRPCEVLVVDDGSNDGTPERLKRFCGAIKYIRQENRGLSSARNLGIRESRGELLAFLDADDMWLPGKLKKQVDAISEGSHVGLVHTDLVKIDSKGERTGTQQCARGEFSGACYPRFFWSNCGPPSTIMIRRKCIDRVGMFDERITRPSTQDYDLWFRIARYYDLRYVDEQLTLYRVHGANSSTDHLMMAQDELYVIRKALRVDSTLMRKVGKHAVRRRLRELYCDIAYELQRRGGDASGLVSASAALRYGVLSRKSWKLFLLACAPHEVRVTLQRWTGCDRIGTGVTSFVLTIVMSALRACTSRVKEVGKRLVILVHAQ
jgi:GT2 family glycosyltransferase